MMEINLREVLEEYALAAPDRFESDVLRRMIEKYPQFAAEIQDFAAARSIAKHVPDPELSAEETARSKQMSAAILQKVLAGNQSASGASLESLTDAAKAKGLSRSKFAAALGLTVSLVQYLEKRRLDFTTIPKAVINKIAGVLEAGEETVSNYLNRPPDLLTNASFKTADRPGEIKPKSFAEAVREDQTLTAAEKNKLLEL